jgi:hypothetical protein
VKEKFTNWPWVAQQHTYGGLFAPVQTVSVETFLADAPAAITCVGGWVSTVPVGTLVVGVVFGTVVTVLGTVVVVAVGTVVVAGGAITGGGSVVGGGVVVDDVENKAW